QSFKVAHKVWLRPATRRRTRTFLEMTARRDRCVENGWGARIRTWEWRYQKPLPYPLATPQRGHEGAAKRPGLVAPPPRCNSVSFGRVASPEGRRYKRALVGV